MQHGKQTLGQMLVAANLIDEVQMQIALAEQRHTGKRFGSTLVDLKFIDENVLAAFLSKQIDVPCISLLHIDIPKKVLRRMTMIERFYPDEERGEDTLRVKRLVTTTGDTVTDPIFLDIIEELDGADLDRRLARMERSLDQIWILLEKALRTLEISEKT
jgi:hypothetical protein